MLFVNSLYEVSSCYVSLYNNLQVCTSLFQVYFLVLLL